MRVLVDFMLIISMVVQMMSGELDTSQLTAETWELSETDEESMGPDSSPKLQIEESEKIQGDIAEETDIEGPSTEVIDTSAGMEKTGPALAADSAPAPRHFLDSAGR